MLLRYTKSMSLFEAFYTQHFAWRRFKRAMSIHCEFNDIYFCILALTSDMPYTLSLAYTTTIRLETEKK